MSKKRDSNIELLRIVLMIGVIILHFNNKGIGKGLALVESGSANEWALMALESIFICAVDTFVLITGYYLVNSKKNSLHKPIHLCIETIFMFEFTYIIGSLISNNDVSLRRIIGNLLPVNYFLILYIALYLVSPLLNSVINKLSLKDFTRVIVLLFILFSVEPTIVDVLAEITGNEYAGLSTVGLYGSQYGYSIVNFILMYFIGAYLNLSSNEFFESRIKTGLSFLILVILILLWAKINDRTACEYCNPFVVAESVMLFCLFKNMHFESKIINQLSKAAFTVFLIHEAAIPFFSLDNVVNKNVFVMVLLYFTFGIFIYLCGWVIYFIYSQTVDRLINLLLKNKKLEIINFE